MVMWNSIKVYFESIINNSLFEIERQAIQGLVDSDVAYIHGINLKRIYVVIYAYMELVGKEVM